MKDSGSISDDWIYDLAIDDKKNLWVATNNGINLYNYKSDNFTKFSIPPDRNGNDSQGCREIFCDQTGSIIAAAGTGIAVFDRGKRQFTRNHPLSDILSGKIVNRLYEDKSGRIWAASEEGLYCYNPADKLHQTYLHDAKNRYSISSDEVMAVVQDKYGRIWAGTNNGLNLFDERAGKFFRFVSDSESALGLSDNFILSLYTDSRGNLWAGTFYGLNLYDYSRNKFQSYLHDEYEESTISANRIYSITEDNSGAVWLGTYKGGINRIDPYRKKFKKYSYKQADENPPFGFNVRAILSDSRQNLWVGTDGSGLYYFNKQKNKFIRLYLISGENRNSSILVSCLAEDNYGNIWAGTLSHGLYKINRGDLKSSRVILPGGYRSISSIYKDKENDLWIGCGADGILLYKNKEKRFINLKDIFPVKFISNINSIFQDSEGGLWFSSFGNGLMYFNKQSGEAKYFHPQNSNRHKIATAAVYSVSQDHNGVLWVSTFRNGLLKFNKMDSTFISFLEKDGFPSKYVKAVLPDNKNNLWAATNKGLFKYDPLQMSGRIFDENDGLMGKDFLAGACYKDISGKFYFGGMGGLIEFYPDSIRENPFVPPVVLTDFKVYNQSIDLKQAVHDVKKIILPHDQNFFSFEFTALNFTNPEKNTFMYKMEGLDTGWIYSGTRRYASYTHIAPGEYRFLVKASNNDGIWNTNGIDIAVIIDPPYWQNWWFIALFLAALISGAVSIYRYRINQLLREERLRTRIASDLHDEIAGNLSSIAMFTKIIQQEAVTDQKQMPDQLLDRVISLSHESVTAIREIIWAIDPKPETIFNLLIKSRDMIITACRSKDIMLDFNIPDKYLLPSANLHPDQRKNLWLMIKEILNNAVKHSECTIIHFAVSYISGELRILIRDNGVGFMPDQKYSGKGLQTIKRRAKELNGKIELRTKPGSGSTYVFSLKI